MDPIGALATGLPAARKSVKRKRSEHIREVDFLEAARCEYAKAPDDAWLASPATGRTIDADVAHLFVKACLPPNQAPDQDEAAAPPLPQESPAGPAPRVHYSQDVTCIHCGEDNWY